MGIKFTSEQAVKARRKNRIQVYCFFNLGPRWGWMINVTSRPLYPQERDPVSIVQEAGWTPEPVWTGAENLTTTGIRSPDRPALSELLYRLSYPGAPCIRVCVCVCMYVCMPSILHHRPGIHNMFWHSVTVQQQCIFLWPVHCLTHYTNYNPHYIS
jgi:hypothetical protein